MNCVFCGIMESNDQNHEVIWQDDAHLAFLSRRPEQPGHLLVIPKKHTDYLFDLESDAYAALMEATRKLALPLKETLGVKRITLGVSGFEVPHIHIHLVPANEHGALCTPIDLNWFEKPETLAAVAEKLRPAFAAV